MELGGDIGRRYADVSGDRNPIHMHALTAKPFGFPARDRARDVDEGALPGGAGGPPAGRFTVDVRFRKPLLLPARVEFATRRGEDFTVRDAKKGTPAPRRPVSRRMPNPKQNGSKSK